MVFLLSGCYRDDLEPGNSQALDVELVVSAARIWMMFEVISLVCCAKNWYFIILAASEFWFGYVDWLQWPFMILNK